MPRLCAKERRRPALSGTFYFSVIFSRHLTTQMFLIGMFEIPHNLPPHGADNLEAAGGVRTFKK